MIRITRSHVLAALAVGVLAGLLAALVIPRSEAEGTSAPAGVPVLGPPAVAAARPARGRAQALLVPVRASVHLESRQDDPQEGPDWAVRVFDATSSFPSSEPVEGGEPRAVRCAQLGRVVDGRFGWIDATNTFRPVGFGYQGAPIACGPRDARAGRTGVPEHLVLLTAPSGPAVRLREGVVWGLAGTGVRTLTADVDGVARTLPTGAQGGYLTVVPAALQGAQVAVQAVLTDGRSVDLDVPPPPTAPRFPPGAPKWVKRIDRDLGRPSRQPAVVTARAPDPAGGLPWGLAAVPERRHRGWCTSMVGRIVDGRVGDIDGALGTFTDAPAYSCRMGKVGPNAGRPVDVAGELGGSSGGRPSAARIARRTQAGTTKVFGTSLPSVESITVRSPRDVRTLVPTGPARAFIVVYDGSFPTGGPVVTATLRGGRTWSQRTGPSPGSGG